MNRICDRRWLHPLLLLFWVAIGIGLRFTNLTLKPLWTDEFSTIVFSLGNSFLTVPLNQPISLDTLLEPLRVNPQAEPGAVVAHLLNESNHPPLYFVLTHLWLNLFSTLNGLGLVWAVRSLAALLGVAAIPAAFWLSWLTFRSCLVGHLAAALMAVSPFNIYLAQEARHYTLPILWVIASLACLVTAVRAICDRIPLPLWVCCLWVGVNGLGIATHYFFSVTLIAEAFVIVGLGLWRRWHQKGERYFLQGWRIGAVAVGTLASGLIWLPFLQGAQDSELTRWIYRGDRTGLALLEPIAQAIGGWITMLYLLPIQAGDRAVVVVSVVIMLLMTVWTVPKLYRGLKPQVLQPRSRLSALVLGGVVLGAIALFLGASYILGMDVTSAFRYNFVFFPAVMVLLGAALSPYWLEPKSRKTVVLIGVVSFLGGLTVITNLGYQKTHRPDLVVDAMREHSQNPALVAIAHRTHGQTGRLMGIGWEWNYAQPSANSPKPLFLLAHQEQNEREPIAALRRSLVSLPRPLDLWLVNFKPVAEAPLQALLKRQACTATVERESVDGYEFEMYRCSSPT